MRFDYPVKIWYQSPPEILQFYNFASLAGKRLTTPPFWGILGVLSPLMLWVVIQTPQKAHPWVMTRHISHKWLKSVPENRTTKKSQKRDISHIGGKAPRKDIAMKFEIWHSGRCPRGSYVGKV